MTQGNIETEITLHVRIRYSYSYDHGSQPSMRDPGEASSEELNIEAIEVLDAANKVLGILDQSWVHQLEIECIEDNIREDVRLEAEPEYNKDEGD